MVHFFIVVYTYFRSHKKLLIGLLVLLITGLTLSLLRLEYKEDVAEFLPDNQTNEQINTVYQHIGNSNKLIINFSLKDSSRTDPERIIEAVDCFTLLLNERDSLHTIPEILSQIDENQIFEVADFIQKNVPYFLTETDYLRIDSLLSEKSIALQLKEDKQLLLLPSGGVLKQTIVADPLHLFTPLLSGLQSFRMGNGEELNQGYLFSNQGKKGMAVITSPYGTSETKQNTELIALIDQTIAQTVHRFPDMNISCFGIPAISVTNANQIKKDSASAISVSVILILILIVYFFRNARNIFLIFFSVAFGWLFALGLFALFKESISIIVLGISSIFVGIAINYPLHFIDHLKHQKNIKQALKEITPPLLIGNITTVGAFFSLIFINSNAMRDMGLCASLMLVGAILFVLIYLPHFVKVGREEPGDEIRPVSSWGEKILGKFAAFAPEKKKWILLPVLLLTCWFLYLSQFTTFELDMDKVSYMTDQQRADMQDAQLLIEKKDRDIVYFVSEGRSMDDALSVYEQNTGLLDSLHRQKMVESIAGIGTFLASEAEQQRRIGLWNDFWSARKEKLLQQIEQYAKKEGFKSGSFEPFSQLLSADYIPREIDYFAPVTSLLADRFLIKNETNNMVINLLYCEKDKTEAVEEVIRQASEGTFFFDSRSILLRLVDSLSDDFNYVLYVCGFIVFIFLTLSFGRLELSLISFIPLAVSWIWILGLMQLGDMRFNIVNIILASFIFGQGDDYTIFIIEGSIYEYTYRRKMLASYKNSILLSAVIMFIGIGTLIFAKHPAMRSLAEVTIVGMFSVVIMAYMIPPFLFRRMTQKRNKFRDIPLTIGSSITFLYSFIAFSTGCLLTFLAGFLLCGIGPKSEKRKMRYHAFLCKVAGRVLRIIPGVRFKCENLADETFEKPAVIISNHQSGLDLMCLMSLTPRLIILTNDWVWHNVFVGRIVRYADFYPVSNGVELCLEKLSDLVQKGYSIAVFPEGTRSKDCSILRFHRGAFYLAEMLKLDILPVFLHGAGHVLPKNEIILRKGAVTAQIHPRITCEDTCYGSGYGTRSKQIRQYYRQTYSAIAQQYETAEYFKNFVLHNYLYKGAEVERSVRRTLKRKNAYSRWIDAYKGQGPVLITNAGYGEFGFLFSLVHKQIQVIVVEKNEDKVRLLQNCVGIPANLTVCNETELSPETTFETVFELMDDEPKQLIYNG